MNTISNTYGVDQNKQEVHVDEKVKVGIKETTELIDAVDALVVDLEEKSKDGKLSLGEIATAIPEVVTVVKEAEDFDAIKEELKDLDREELETLALKSISTIYGVAGIVKNLT